MKTLLYAPDAAPAASAPTAPAAPKSPAPSPSAPSASASPAPTPTAKAGQGASDAPDPFDELDARYNTKRHIEEPKAPEPPKPPAEPTKEKAAATPPPPSPGPKQLREEYEKTKAELKAKSDEITALQTKYQEAEAKGKETATLAERLAAREKEFEALQVELRAVKGEMSPEFKAQYEKPFMKAAALAEREVNQLQVLDPDTQEPVRKASFDRDFTLIYGLDRLEAKKQALKLFGDEAGIVMEHYTALHRLDDLKRDAEQEERASWKTKEEQRTAQESQRREAVKAMFSKVTADIQNKHPEWFGEDPKDEERNAVLKEGYALVDSRFNNKALTIQQQVVLDAQIRHRAAAFGWLNLDRSRLAAKLEEANNTIAELRKSKPGATERQGGEERGESEVSWHDAAEKELPEAFK